MMTVAELVEKLSTMPQDMKVVVESSYGEYSPGDCRSIYIEFSTWHKCEVIVIDSEEIS